MSTLVTPGLQRLGLDLGPPDRNLRPGCTRRRRRGRVRRVVLCLGPKSSGFRLPPDWGRPPQSESRPSRDPRYDSSHPRSERSSLFLFQRRQSRDLWLGTTREEGCRGSLGGDGEWILDYPLFAGGTTLCRRSTRPTR